jgi:hypothetical protein
VTRLLGVTGIMVVLAAVTGHASAGDLLGFGGLPCSEFLQESADSEKEMIYFVWATGFMGAWNYEAVVTGRPAVNMLPPDFPVKDQQAFIKSFCYRNPTLPYVGGAASLYWTMRDRQNLPPLFPQPRG